jgi:hemerythrin-like domain-containing protein
MMMDHQAGKSYVKGMAGGIEVYKSGDTTVREEIFENMIGYVELLRSHIAKENNVLFRMADNCLSDEENKELLAEFALAEQKHNGNKTFADYVSSIENLSVIYEI